MDDIVSYIYDEIGAAERTKFETHLRGLLRSAPTNLPPSQMPVFRSLNGRRKSLHIYQRRRSSSPMTRKELLSKNLPRLDLLSGLRGWLSLVKFPAAVAAGLIVCAGLGFLLLTYLGRDEQQIASNRNNSLPAEIRALPDVTPKVETLKPETAATKDTPPSLQPNRDVQKVKAVKPRRAISKKQLTARNPVNRNATQNISNAPVLSENYEEADDNSLRLSDLFADVDG